MEIETESSADIVVLGIGNSLLGDDGVGIHAVARLRGEPGDDHVTLIDGGTLNFTLLEYIEGADGLIVIDAAELAAEPGSVSVFEDAAMDSFVSRSGRRSVHEVGLTDLLSMAALRNRLPKRRALVSVQPQQLDWSEDLSPPVAQGLVEACAQTRRLVAGWAA